MNKYEEKVQQWIDEGYECITRYDRVYGWWGNEKISDELWEQFSLACLEELAGTSTAVLAKIHD